MKTPTFKGINNLEKSCVFFQACFVLSSGFLEGYVCAAEKERPCCFLFALTRTSSFLFGFWWRLLL